MKDEQPDLIRRYLSSELVAEGHVLRDEGKLIWPGRYQDYEVTISVRPVGTIRLSEN